MQNSVYHNEYCFYLFYSDFNFCKQGFESFQAVLTGDVEGILKEGAVSSGEEYVKYLLSIIKANK